MTVVNRIVGRTPPPLLLSAIVGVLVYCAVMESYIEWRDEVKNTAELDRKLRASRFSSSSTGSMRLRRETYGVRSVFIPYADRMHATLMPPIHDHRSVVVQTCLFHDEDASTMYAGRMINGVDVEGEQLAFRDLVVCFALRLNDGLSASSSQQLHH